MTITLYDSTNVADIPETAEAVAGYVDGQYRNLAELTARFPDKPVISITVTGIGGVRVADVETGDLTPMQGAEWAKAEIAAGRRPTLYYARATGQAIAACLNGALVDPFAVDYWVADWTGDPHLIKGSVATQYADPTTSGGHYDLSLAEESWIKPATEPPNNLTEGEDMTQYEQGGQTHVVVYEANRNRTVHYWQASPGTAPPGAPADFYAWHSEALPEPA